MAGQSLLTSLALRLCLFSIFAAVSSSTKCYYYDGTPAVNDVPCTNKSPSPCCGKEEVCLKNGLCLSTSQPFGLSRGSCTEDNGWLSHNCPQYCRKKEPSAGSSIVLFNGTSDEWYYCCDGVGVVNGVLSCLPFPDNSVQYPFKIHNGASSPLIPGVALLSGLEKSPNSTSRVANTTIPSTNTSNSTEPSGSSSQNAAVGAGVGIPLGIIALLSIAWALWERRKRRQAIKSMAPQMSFEQNSGYRHAAFSELPGSHPEPVELDESLSNGEGSHSHVGTHSFISRSNGGSTHH